MFKQKLIDMIRKTAPNKIAEELVNVQPINLEIGKLLMEHGMNEDELIAEGYTPVSHHKIMWIKKK